MGISLSLPRPLVALRSRRPQKRLPLRAMACAALALPVLGGGWLWLRDSSLVAVEHVHIAGVHGTQALEIRHALDAAAAHTSTLHFDEGALRAAVAGYPQVASISARTSFPHSLSVRVVERPAIAVLVGPGERTAIAGDGTVLGPALVSGSLPTIAAKAAVPRPGGHVGEAAAVAATTALAAAPSQLLAHVERVYEGGEGLTLQMRNGLLAYFGDASRPHAKWLSLARVLASPTAAGATYVDVRLPSRPAAGFTQPGSTTGSEASKLTPAQVGVDDPAAAKLAEQLSSEVGGSSPSCAGSESEGHEGESNPEASSEASPTG